MLTVGCPPTVGVHAVAGPVVVVVVVPVGADVTCASAARDATPSAVIDAKTRDVRAKRGMSRFSLSIAHAIRESLAPRGVNEGSIQADQPRWQRDPTSPSPPLTK